MCQVQFIKRLNNPFLTKTDIATFFSLLYKGSYSNRDAYGFFNDKKIYREAKPYYEITNDEEDKFINSVYESKSNFLVGHNRLATQGDKKLIHNNHPFPTKDWIIVHNGVINNDKELCREYNLEYKEDTDSAIIVNLLQHFTDNNSTPEQAITTTASLLGGGFSVVAYHKESNRLFYFKNSSQKFTFALVKFNNAKILMGSTDKDNFSDLYCDEEMIFSIPRYKKMYKVEAISNSIYEITDEGISEIGRFESKPYTSAVKNYSYNYYDGTYSYLNKENSESSCAITTSNTKTIQQEVDIILYELEPIVGITPKYNIDTKAKKVFFSWKGDITAEQVMYYLSLQGNSLHYWFEVEKDTDSKHTISISIPELLDNKNW